MKEKERNTLGNVRNLIFAVNFLTKTSLPQRRFFIQAIVYCSKRRCFDINLQNIVHFQRALAPLFH